MIETHWVECSKRPDGIRVGGLDYPHMIECPDCEGVGTNNATTMEEWIDGCETCDGSGEVRNDALEWVWVCIVDDMRFFFDDDDIGCRLTQQLNDDGSTEFVEPYFHGAECGWVSLGLKP